MWCVIYYMVSSIINLFLPKRFKWLVSIHRADIEEMFVDSFRVPQESRRRAGYYFVKAYDTFGYFIGFEFYKVVPIACGKCIRFWFGWKMSDSSKNVPLVFSIWIFNLDS